MARTKKLDFTSVESYSRCSEGIHPAKLTEVTEATSQAGDDMLKVVFEVISGDDKGCRVFDNFVLTDKALWKLKQYLTAVNVKCDGKVAIDLDKLIGKICEIEVFHEEYNGVVRAKIQTYIKPKRVEEDVDDEDEDEDEEPEVKPAKAKAKAKPEPEPEPEDDDDDDDDDDDEEEVAPPPKAKKGKAEAKTDTKAEKVKAKAAPKDEDDDDDDDDWEDV